MTRAPFVQGKAPEAFARTAEIYDTTIGWRFVNPLMKQQYGIDSMPETGENVAEEFQITRADQDAFALRSQQRAGKAIASGYFAKEIVAVEVLDGKAGPIKVDRDEHPRPDTTLEQLAKLKTPFRNPGTVTAGNASGVNYGAAAMIVASETAVKTHGLTPRARNASTNRRAKTHTPDGVPNLNCVSIATRINRPRREPAARSGSRRRSSSPALASRAR